MHKQVEGGFAWLFVVVRARTVGADFQALFKWISDGNDSLCGRLEDTGTERDVDVLNLCQITLNNEGHRMFASLLLPQRVPKRI